MNSIFKFPCQYPLKIIGLADSVEAVAIPIIRKHSPDIGEAAFKFTPSSDNKYVSITATINAQSKEQLDALYRDLTSQKEILIVL